MQDRYNYMLFCFNWKIRCGTYLWLSWLFTAIANNHVDDHFTCKTNKLQSILNQQYQQKFEPALA